jgi:hypothetical protein
LESIFVRFSLGFRRKIAAVAVAPFASDHLKLHSSTSRNPSMASAAEVQLDVDEKSPEVPAVEMQSSSQKGGSASAAAAATHFWKVPCISARVPRARFACRPRSFCVVYPFQL